MSLNAIAARSAGGSRRQRSDFPSGPTIACFRAMRLFTSVVASAAASRWGSA